MTPASMITTTTTAASTAASTSTTARNRFIQLLRQHPADQRCRCAARC